MVMIMIWQFNGTSTPKGSYRAKTGDNDCSVNSSRYSPRTALCENICYQAKSEKMYPSRMLGNLSAYTYAFSMLSLRIKHAKLGPMIYIFCK